MMPTLALDLDSTLWDTGAGVREAAFEVTGERLDVGSTWTHVLDACGEEAATEIFDRVFSPEAIRAREPYPGAAEVIRHLRRGLGMEVHVVTRGHDPGALRPHLELWLGERFGPEIGLTVTTGDKLPVLREIGAFGMIDDRPETLERVADAGLWAAARIQPWNRELVAARPDVHGFSDWREVPNLLPVL
jgi:phosphoglycolate phosphatase-like HAD superfamily hydrolase